MNYCFALILLFFLKPRVQSFEDTATLLSAIITDVFQDKILCYISDKNEFNNIVERSLVNGKTEVISLSYNHLKHVRKNVPCSGYVVTLQDGDDFLRYYNRQKEYTFAFKPWTRLLLMYKRPPLNISNLYLLSRVSAIDVIVIDLPKNDKNSTVIVTSLYKNTTILTWRPNKRMIDWAKFRPVKWTPGELNFTVTVFHCPPFVFLNKNGEVEGGVEIQVVQEAMKNKSVKYIILKASDDEDNWALSSEAVEKNLSHLAVCTQWYLSTYGKNVEMTYPVRQICSTFIVKKPMLLPDFSFVFQEFQAPVYRTTFIMLLLVSLLLTLEWYFYKSKEKLHLIPDYVMYPFHLLRILSMGGVSKLPVLTLTSAKFLLGCWCWYCLIFATYYSAGMTSCLTNPRYQENVNTLQDMLDYKVQWFGKISVYQDYLFGFNTTFYNSLARLFVIKNNNSDSVETAARMVKTVERRYVTEVEELPQEIRKYYKVLDECMSKYYTGFLFQINSPYTRLFEDTVIKLVESGIYGNWIDRILNQADDSQRTFFTNYIEDPDKHIDLKKIKGAFFLLAGGNILGCISFIVEYWIRKI